jgi:hypothetical protein
MRGFFNVLQLLAECTGYEYNSCYAEVKTEIYKLFNKYENKLVQLDLKGLHNHQTVQVRKNRHGEESLEVVEQVLLVLPLPLPPLHLHLLLLFVSS